MTHPSQNILNAFQEMMKPGNVINVAHGWEDKWFKERASGLSPAELAKVFEREKSVYPILILESEFLFLNDEISSLRTKVLNAVGDIYEVRISPALFEKMLDLYLVENTIRGNGDG